MEPEGGTRGERRARGGGERASERVRGEERKKGEEKPERRHRGRLSTCVRSFSLEDLPVVFMSCL